MNEILDYMPGRVIRWGPAYREPSLGEQLKTHPGQWGVIGEKIPGDVLQDRLRSLSLGDQFEVTAEPYDDGPYGVLYEISARYIDERDDGGKATGEIG